MCNTNRLQCQQEVIKALRHGPGSTNKLFSKLNQRYFEAGRNSILKVKTFYQLAQPRKCHHQPL